MIPFDLDRLERETFVRGIVYLDEADSTSRLALELAERDDGALPLLVLAARQTAGRGRGANRWWSSEGALTFSLILDAANLAPVRRPLVSLAAGLAVCEAIAELLPHHSVGVKWPNDVHLEGKKVCGVLAESPRRGDRLVVGIGINVNNPRTEAPDDVAPRAIALVDAAGGMFSLTEVLTCVLRRFSVAWSALASGHDDSAMDLIERLRRRCVLTGRRIAVEAGEERVAGLCRGLADDGALLLDSPAGPRRLYAGVAVEME